MKFFSKYNNMLRQLDVIKIFAFLMVIINGYLGFTIISDKQNDKVIITPSIITSEFSSVGNIFSKEYFEMVGEQLANALLTVSPHNIDTSFDSIQKYLSTDPDEIKAIKEYLLDNSERIKKDSIFQAFYPIRTSVNYKHNKFTVEGFFKSSTGNLPLENTKKRITFFYKVISKRLIIKKFEVQ